MTDIDCSFCSACDSYYDSASPECPSCANDRYTAALLDSEHRLKMQVVDLSVKVAELTEENARLRADLEKADAAISYTLTTGDNMWCYRYKNPE